MTPKEHFASTGAVSTKASERTPRSGSHDAQAAPVAVLIVDDNAANLQVMEHALEADSYSIVTAPSGREALRLLLEREFAVIFMDVRMPVLNGFETAKLIRQHPKSANVPIIFLTAYAQDDAQEIFHGYSTGAVDFLVKPVAAEILRSKAAVFAELHRMTLKLRSQEEQLRQNRDDLERRVAERTAALEESLSEKELLLKEIHHRVKNNLQIVSSILSLQSNHIEDPAFLEIFQESQSRIKSIALVHELLYERGHLAQINFGEYLRDLVTSIVRTISAGKKPIQYRVEAESVMIELDSAIHCGLIVNELVMNAVKYAFPDDRTGTITVRLEATGPLYELRIADDGVGLPVGVDVGKTTTMGLQLVDTLVEQVGATLITLRENGTTFLLRFSSDSPGRRKK